MAHSIEIEFVPQTMELNPAYNFIKTNEDFVNEENIYDNFDLAPATSKATVTANEQPATVTTITVAAGDPKKTGGKQRDNFIKRNEDFENKEDIYDNVDLPLATSKATVTADEQPSTVTTVTVAAGDPKKTGEKQRGVNIAFTIAIVTVLCLVVVAITASVLLTSNFNQEIQSLQMEIENLREMLNQTDRSLESQVSSLAMNTQTQNDILTSEVQELRNALLTCTNKMTTIEPPTATEPPITTESLITTESPITDIACCNTTQGWTSVVDLTVSASSRQCPDGLSSVSILDSHNQSNGIYVCRKNFVLGCNSVTFPVNSVFEYSQVCGRILAYMQEVPDAFQPYHRNTTLTIDDAYVDGISLTHGQLPRKHIWTFAAVGDDFNSESSSCPCVQNDTDFPGTIPPFVGQDYFCETAKSTAEGITDSMDPLWDGQGCEGDGTCCSFNDPPWFCKQLPQPTTDDIELRLCADDYYENIYPYSFKIFVK